MCGVKFNGAIECTKNSLPGDIKADTQATYQQNSRTIFSLQESAEAFIYSLNGSSVRPLNNIVAVGMASGSVFVQSDTGAIYSVQPEASLRLIPNQKAQAAQCPF